MSKKDFDLSIFRQSRITGKAKIQHYEGTELRPRNLDEMMQNLCHRKQIESTSLIKPKVDLARKKRFDR